MQPDRALFSNEPAARMVKRLADDDAAASDPRHDKRNRRCIQNAGDVIILPRGWGHLTYNLQASIGLAKEIHIDALPQIRSIIRAESAAVKESSTGHPETAPGTEEF